MQQSGEQSSVLHSWCVPSEWQAPTVIGGQGAWLHLVDGSRLLDMSSLAECSNLGHQHPGLVAAIKAQADTLCFVTNQWGADVRARLAEQLLDIAGFDGGRVFFTLAGTDANEHAVKIARLVAGKPQGGIITRDRSYHGASYFGMALSGDARTQPFIDAGALGVRHVPPPYAYRCPFGTDNAEDCGRAAAQAVLQAIHAGTVAVLMEPNAGTNGIVPPGNYWPELRRITREQDVLLIADEVMSGFGRCGQWFAWQNHGADNAPDIITCAKGLTGAALPLGAVIISAAVYEKIKDRMLYAGLTYCGHPMSCAVGLAAVQAYRDENLIERSKQLGLQLYAELQAMQRRHPVIGDVRGGHGLFAVLELVSERSGKTPLAPWPQLHPKLAALVQEALALGVSFAVRGNLIILAPPLVITPQDMAQALTCLDQLLEKYFKEITP